MSNKSPAFQFYPDEWLTDLDVAIMTPQQEGAYIRLVCYCWLDNDLSIPDNDDQLIVLSRLSNGGLDLVKAKFKKHPTKLGFLTHKRLQNEAEKQIAWRKKSAEGGKKSSRKYIESKEKNKGGSRMVATKAQANVDSPSPSPSILINPQTPLNSQRGFEKNSEGFFSVEKLLDDNARMRAKQSAPGWDIYFLMRTYDENINSGAMQRPSNPSAAFPAWCTAYTKGKSP